MLTEFKIVSTEETRRGVSAKGNAYCVTALHIRFLTKGFRGDDMVQNLVVTIMGELDEEVLNNAIAQEKSMNGTLLFDVREYQNNKLNNPMLFCRALQKW